MKKKLTSLNQPLWMALLVILAFSVKSCRKDITGGSNQPIPQQVKWAKNYYDTNLQPNEKKLLIPSKTMSSGKSGSTSRTNKISIQWNKGYSAQTSLYDFVEVPINMEGKMMPTFLVTKDPTAKPVLDLEVMNASLNRLIIYKDPAGNTNQRLITYVPDRSYLDKAKGDISKNNIDNIDKDFFGYLQYKDWEGNVLWILRIENGMPIRKIDVSGAMSPADAVKISSRNRSGGQGKIMRYEVATCGEWTIKYNWEQWCYYYGDSQTPYACDPPEVYNVLAIPNCPGGGGPTPRVDCNDPLNFESAECFADISDKISNECLRNLWNALKSNTKGKIINLLNSTFGQNHSINFKIFDGDVSGGAPAQSQVLRDRVTSQGERIFDVKVTINKTTMPGYSQEFAAATIVHEIMHCYFNANKTYYNNQFKQHQTMAEEYIESMKSAVTDIFPNMPAKDAYALTMNGFNDMFENNLTGWNALLTKYNLTTQEIYNTQVAYKSSAQNAPGTKCPPKQP